MMARMFGVADRAPVSLDNAINPVLPFSGFATPPFLTVLLRIACSARYFAESICGRTVPGAGGWSL